MLLALSYDRHVGKVGGRGEGRGKEEKGNNGKVGEGKGDSQTVYIRNQTRSRWWGGGKGLKTEAEGGRGGRL